MPESAVEIARQLSEPERRILQLLGSADRAWTLDEVAAQAGFGSENEAYSSASWLQRKGLVEISETAQTLVGLGADGVTYARDGFPERRVYQYVGRRAHGVPLAELKREFPAGLVDIALSWWKRKGLGTIERTTGDTALRANPAPPPAEDEDLLRRLAAGPLVGGATVAEQELREQFGKSYEQLRARPGLVEPRTVKRRSLRPTELGREAARAGPLQAGLVGEVTPEMVQSGAWRGREFQAYDVRTEPPRILAAKPHPLLQIIDEVRSIFTQLGFEEIEEEYVQSAFWNMDALFIPQDHPAREMQDTLYLARPPTLDVPQDLVERISRVHENGGDTKSRGWGQPLDAKESRRALLRTHTTVGTIRYLARHPQPPVRVFSIGRVFRNETMDATHLPEFHQIEGIATEKGADFPMLLGILQEFYRRLGFPKLRWRPAFFPYTEPSMEVEVWTGQKWMELGGCGIFRPEVTQPFGVPTPVLAWGLGLERLAMMRLGLKDIRDLYVSDLEWLRNQPLL